MCDMTDYLQAGCPPSARADGVGKVSSQMRVQICRSGGERLFLCCRSHKQQTAGSSFNRPTRIISERLRDLEDRPLPQSVNAIVEHLKGEVRKAIVGQDAVIEQVLIVLLTEGHALIEGVPGTAKTLLVKVLARAIGAQFGRIQFTPDLMPADVTGTNIFNMATSTFTLRHGPIFTDMLLADEINRTPPKTQAALLEAMEERQVTIDGDIHKLSPMFTVLATQNPIEYEGTYPLPEAQLDRFLMKVVIDYPRRATSAPC